MTTQKTREAGLLRRAISEYREMPGLALTFEQACRLWDCDEETCKQILGVLLQRGMLRRTRDGRIVCAD